MRSHLSILSACAVSAILLAGCGNNDRKDFYPEDRTATSPAPKRLNPDFATNVYGHKEYQADSEKVVMATEDAINWSVKPEKKPMAAEGSSSILSDMPALKAKPVTIQPMINDSNVPKDNDYLGNAYKSSSSPVLESYKQVAGSNFETRSSSSVSPTPMARNVTNNESVEIFDIEGSATVKNGKVPTMNAPQPYQAREGVTIYPLEGGSNSTQPQYVPIPLPTGNTMNYSGSSYSDEGKIYFKHGSDRLGSGDKRRLTDIAKQAKTASRVEVEGYASKPTQSNNTITSKVLNLKESMNRSFAVSKDLIKKGVPAEKIKTVGWGEAHATGDNSHDRRVDVTVNPY